MSLRLLRLCEFSSDTSDKDPDLVALLDIPIEFDKPEKVSEVVLDCLKKFAEKK